jgi:hypothetical protein
MAKTVYSLDDCKKHVSDKDCWLVVHGGRGRIGALPGCKVRCGGKPGVGTGGWQRKGAQHPSACRCPPAGKVYDVTAFLEEHPGGYDVILTSSGALLDREGALQGRAGCHRCPGSRR